MALQPAAAASALNPGTVTSSNAQPTGHSRRPSGDFVLMSSEAKSARLTMHGEAQLMAFFSLQDTLSKTETGMLASRVGYQ